jgi:hypothetical protein
MSVKRSRLRTLVRNLLHWDCLTAAAIAIAFLILTLSSDRPLEDSTGPLTLGVTAGIAVALGAALAGRWLTDRIQDDDYGELLRVLDPDESVAQAPFHTVTLVAAAAAVGSALLLLARDELSRTLAAVAYSAVVFLVMYAILGLVDLLLLLQRHQRRQARLRSMREQEKRRREEE